MAKAEATVSVGKVVDVRGGKLTVHVEGEPSIAVGTEPRVVGRDASCHLVVKDRHVSSVHAELVATERGVRVRDLGSRNGTWAHDMAIVETYLTKTTKLAFGAVEATFTVAAPERVEVGGPSRLGELYGANPAMRRLFTQIARIAETDLTALVLGETGTGKELVARAIHDESPRRERPFVVVDCGGIAPSLAESMLFGHTKGAFTGAVSKRVSPFVEAAGGTVFLDEIGELPSEVQPRLLRALAEKRVKAVGAKDYEAFDARIVAATRRDLTKAINDGTFRSDLYFRLAQSRLEVPALRDRLDDLPELVKIFLGDASALKRVPRDAMMRLLRHDWPGNVRELRNAVVVARAMAGPDEPIDISTGTSDDAATALSYKDAKHEALRRFERGYFALLLAECGGSVVELARRSGLQRAHVRKYLVLHGLHPSKKL